MVVDGLQTEKQSKNQRIKSHRAPGGFLSGVLVLSVSTVLVKVIGLAYKIPMMAQLGAVGMGYFNSAYEIYAVLCVISTAGLPVALSMLIAAKREGGAEHQIGRIYRSAWTVFLVLGLLGSGVMLALAKPIARAIGNEQAYACILAVAPALLMICLASAVRGYFQGLGDMMPTALSQLIEAMGKLVFGVWFASVAMKRGLPIEWVAACAIFGLTLGTVLSALYLALAKWIGRFRAEKSHQSIRSGGSSVTELLRIAIPITLGSALMSLTRMVDMTFMMHRLQDIGYSSLATNAIYGSYTTLAVPVFGLIPALITPITLVLVPQLSAAIERKDGAGQVRLTDDSIRLTVLLGMPASFGIAVFASPILSILFSGQWEAIDMAAPLLAVLGASILFSGLITTTNAVLQAYRKPMLPILSMGAGLLVKAVSAYILIGMPEVGAYGAPISTFLCNLCVSGINICFLNRCVPKSDRSLGMMQLYGKPMLASAASVTLSAWCYHRAAELWEGELFAFLIAVGVAAAAYLILIFLMKIVTFDDIKDMLPKGSHLLDKKKGRIKE